MHPSCRDWASNALSREATQKAGQLGRPLFIPETALFYAALTLPAGCCVLFSLEQRCHFVRAGISFLSRRNVTNAPIKFSFDKSGSTRHYGGVPKTLNGDM